MSDDRAPIDLDALEHDMDMQGASEGDLYCLPVRDVLDLIAECRRLRAKIERVRDAREEARAAVARGEQTPEWRSGIRAAITEITIALADGDEHA